MVFFANSSGFRQNEVWNRVVGAARCATPGLGSLDTSQACGPHNGNGVRTELKRAVWTNGALHGRHKARLWLERLAIECAVEHRCLAAGKARAAEHNSGMLDGLADEKDAAPLGGVLRNEWNYFSHCFDTIS